MNKFLMFALLLCIFLPDIGYAQRYGGSGLSVPKKKTIEFFNLQWRNSKTEISEAHVDESITIKFTAKNVPDNEIIDVEIWEQTDGELMDFINTLHGTVKRGVVELDWVIEFDIHNQDTHYAREIAENGYTTIDYVFLIKHKDVAVSSKPLAILSWVYFLFLDERTEEPIRNSQFMLYAPDGASTIHTTDAEGYAKIMNLRKAGQYRVTM
ncbi:MAG: hypothetical protein LBG87_01395 [Spirochaetaceae bacterium]|jgi:hypothetical protein|nr:hypothetical protein [Spirochaetaceae bacterium]